MTRRGSVGQRGQMKRLAKRRPERPKDAAELGRIVVEVPTGPRPNDSFEEGEPPEPEGRARARRPDAGAPPGDRQESCGRTMGAEA